MTLNLPTRPATLSATAEQALRSPETDQLPAPQRRVRLTAASTIRTARASWAWDTAARGGHARDAEGRIPVGAITVAAGRAGIGKSQFTAWLAAQVTRGTLPGEYYGRPRGVVIAATEDSWSMTIVPRLIAAGADLELIYKIDVETDDDSNARLSLPADLTELRGALYRHDVVLLICDPLLSLLSADVNDYRAAEVRTALEPLAQMAENTRCAVVGLAHFTKSGGSDPLLAISGSAAFGQVIRAAVGFARDEQDDSPVHVLSTIKNSLGREDLPSLTYDIQATEVDTDDGPSWVSRFVLGAASDRSVRDIMVDTSRGGNDPEAGPARTEAADFLVNYLNNAGGSAAAGDVITAATRAGIAKRTLQEARKRSGVVSRKDGLAGGWVWAFPEDATQGAEGATSPHVAPSASSPAPSVHCGVCGEPMVDLGDGHTTHPNCTRPAA